MNPLKEFQSQAQIKLLKLTKLKKIMIIKNLFTIVIVLFSFIANSQCIKGNCENGEGTYEYTDEGTFVGVFKNGEAFKGKFNNTMFSETIIFEGYFIETENGLILDPTKKGKMYHTGLELEGFISEKITAKDNKKSYEWVLNGLGEKILPLQTGGFRVEKGNFTNNILNDKNATIIYSNGTKYLGGVVMGKRQGLGKEITPEGGHSVMGIGMMISG